MNGTLAKGLLYQDSLRPAAELDGSGNVVSFFVYGDGGLAPLYMIKGGTKYRILTDHLGSPRLVVDSATGEIAQRIDYDAFGAVTADSSPGFQPFGFAGGLYDPDTGLVRFGARDYDAAAGRWTAKDPMAFGGGDTNLYAYAGNDPVNRTDPKGTGGLDPQPQAQLAADASAVVKLACEAQKNAQQRDQIIKELEKKVQDVERDVAAERAKAEGSAGNAWSKLLR